ncbi:Protein of unknown function [Leuconostoc citreum LBAE C10]|nr:Protein of unknown function [Leuconostoc citreum LBAE C10]
MNDKTWARIKKYTEHQGTSGQEHLVRQALRQDMQPLVDEIHQDGLGGIFGVKNINRLMHRASCLRRIWMKSALLLRIFCLLARLK